MSEGLLTGCTELIVEALMHAFIPFAGVDPGRMLWDPHLVVVQLAVYSLDLFTAILDCRMPHWTTRTRRGESPWPFFRKEFQTVLLRKENGRMDILQHHVIIVDVYELLG